MDLSNAPAIESRFRKETVEHGFAPNLHVSIARSNSADACVRRNCAKIRRMGNPTDGCRSVSIRG